MTEHSIFRPTYTEEEVSDSVRALKRWRDGEVDKIIGRENREEYPFVVGAVPALLWAFEQLTETPADVVVPIA